MRDKPKRFSGFTLLEVMVAGTILVILASFGVPQFQKAFEQSRVDLAGAHLESIWTAQRLYRAGNSSFASSITDLSSFLDSSFTDSSCIGTSPPCGSSCDFCYSIESATADAFTAVAKRNYCASGCKTSFWSGSIEINQAGTISGNTSGGNHTIFPSKF